MVTSVNSKKLQTLDAHSHLRFTANGHQIAKQLEKHNVYLIDTGVTPKDIVQAESLFSDCENVFIAPGLHPWWIADKTCTIQDAYRLGQLCSQYKFIGEIGLDFSDKCLKYQTKDLQTQAFKIICEVAAASYNNEKHILSIHSVRSASHVLDILENTGCIQNCKCIFHWFSGSQEELIRAIDDGCWFSIGNKGLKAKRWKNYARKIPANRLLIETDMPEKPGDSWSWEKEMQSLTEAKDLLDEYLGYSTSDVLRQSSIDLCYS